MVARDCALAAYEGAPHPHPAPVRAESVEALAAAKARGAQVTCEASPHHLLLTDEDVRSARHAPEDEPAAAQPRPTARR